MTKSLQEIQQENRKFILEAIHSCSYEEALQKEWGENCIIEDCILNGSEMASWGRVIKDNRHKSLYANIDSGNQLEFSVNWDDDFKCTIIGKPITLSRVLLAFKNKDVKKNGNGIVFNYDWGNFSSLEENDYGYSDYTPYIFCHLFDWDLTKETLEEQSEETQREVNKLLVGI